MSISVIITIVLAVASLIGSGWKFVLWIMGGMSKLGEEIAGLRREIAQANVQNMRDLTDLQSRMRTVEHEQSHIREHLDDRDNKCDDAIKRLHERIDGAVLRHIVPVLLVCLLFLGGCVRTSEAIVARNADEALAVVQASGEITGGNYLRRTGERSRGRADSGKNI